MVCLQQVKMMDDIRPRFLSNRLTTSPTLVSVPLKNKPAATNAIPARGIWHSSMAINPGWMRFGVLTAILAEALEGTEGTTCRVNVIPTLKARPLQLLGNRFAPHRAIHALIDLAGAYQEQFAALWARLLLPTTLPVGVSRPHARLAPLGITNRIAEVVRTIQGRVLQNRRTTGIAIYCDLVRHLGTPVRRSTVIIS